MKKHNRSRERIEHSLKQMPRVQDKRSKNEIYHNIQDRLDSKKRHRTHRRWPAPVFTSAAILLLAILIVPGIWWTSNQTASPSQEENAEDENETGDSESTERQESENTDEDASDSTGDEESVPAESNTEEEGSPEIQENTEESGEVPAGYVSALTKEESSSGVNAVTIPFESMEGSVIVPLTFVAETDLKNLLSYITEEIDGNDFGLGPAVTEKVSWKDTDNGRLEAAVSSETTNVEAGQIERGIEELARYLGEEGIAVSNISTEDNEDEEIEAGDIEQNRGYYLYDVNESSYLVTGEGAGVSTTNGNGSLLSLEETLVKMNEGPEISEVRAPIPASLTVGNVEEEGESVTISLAGSLEDTSAEVQQAMMDAVGLAAADFGYDSIEFISESSEPIGEVPLNQRWEVPSAPNTMNWKAG
ncbi:hypothetical protein CHL76_00150 [Marinococcus halophilus]|uniref:GerMN domain-containing protein n=1 Tax=Marinococcus halophilus TaxID=1371 RepID=A0A510Y2E4_MARHA|nr:hypothetical protein [Marinococcus halophilus]OZT81545.1 hypothetical protein CHL76_00150 [Marinococcus halophilus]GEK57486.1 hypothetical protein MHA01_03910 [Marinococcus halophilus]